MHLNLVIIVFALLRFVCSERDTDSNYWEIIGIHPAYTLCDSVVFKLNRQTDTNDVCVLIGVEKLRDGEWGSFIRNIDMENDKGVDIVYCFNEKRYSSEIIWRPCWSKWYSHGKLKKHLYGTFRFVYFEYDNSNIKRTKRFYSDSFQISR